MYPLPWKEEHRGEARPEAPLTVGLYAYAYEDS